MTLTLEPFSCRQPLSRMIPFVPSGWYASFVPKFEILNAVVSLVSHDLRLRRGKAQRKELTYKQIVLDSRITMQNFTFVNLQLLQNRAAFMVNFNLTSQPIPSVHGKVRFNRFEKKQDKNILFSKIINVNYLVVWVQNRNTNEL